jgi:hypothetical protein
MDKESILSDETKSGLDGPGLFKDRTRIAVTPALGFGKCAPDIRRHGF